MFIVDLDPLDQTGEEVIFCYPNHNCENGEQKREPHVKIPLGRFVVE